MQDPVVVKKESASGRQTRRVMLTVAYDGTAYSGFALQKTSPKPTIEGLLNHAIHALTGEDVRVTGASRTDAGVHALGNVAVFDTKSPVPPENMMNALNPLLPADVRIVASKEVDAAFHPRHVKCVKTYQYRILNSPVALPTLSRYTHRVPMPLNVNAMREAACFLEGEHDFTSFCNVQTQTTDHVRTVTRVAVEESVLPESACLNAENGQISLITIEITGNGFLYNMVRIIAGTLIRVGTGATAPKDVERILAEKDRCAAGPTAPPNGLVLMGYRY